MLNSLPGNLIKSFALVRNMQQDNPLESALFSFVAPVLVVTPQGIFNVWYVTDATLTGTLPMYIQIQIKNAETSAQEIAKCEATVVAEGKGNKDMVL